MTPRHLETHRERYPQPVQRAMALLDRVSEGQAVDEWEIHRALRLTGDLEWDFAAADCRCFGVSATLHGHSHCRK